MDHGTRPVSACPLGVTCVCSVSESWCSELGYDTPNRYLALGGRPVLIVIIGGRVSASLLTAQPLHSANYLHVVCDLQL